jgi:hypothetical protein
LRDRDEGATIGVYFAHPGKTPGVEDRRENRWIRFRFSDLEHFFVCASAG